MWLNRFWSGIAPLTPRVKALFPDEIQAAPVFLKTIERERARCDRNGQTFSVLSYEMIDESGTEQAGEDFCAFLVKRTRAMDTLGWFDERHLAVLLPETPPTGAQVVALAVAEAFAFSPAFPQCRIFSYPAAEAPGINHTLPTASVSDRHGQPPPPVATHPGVANPANGVCCQQRALGLSPMFGVKPPWWKRGMDLAISLPALIVTAPLMAIIALFIKAVSAGPVLFCQERVGHLGRTFRLYKFRTMHLGADNSGHRKYMAHLIKGDVPMTKIDTGTDPRLIVGARLLRRTCLDELPQLLNVIKGEMSLIGPRPCLPYEAETFLRWHHRRFDVVPGITGLWQVNGKNKTTFKQMIRYDIEYGKKVSFLLDCKILLKTIPALGSMLFEQPSAPPQLPETVPEPCVPDCNPVEAG